LHIKHLEKLVSQQVEQLKNAERLSAIGQTAGMIGHDIRNPLQSIVSEVYLSKTEVGSLPEGETKESLKESLNSIEEDLSYIDKIVQDLQDYAKPPKPTLEKVILEKIIHEVISKMDIPETIQVSLSLEEGSLALTTDPTYMKRILTNLVSNAIQAMTNGGTISVKVKRRENKTLLTVEDTGKGIPPEVRDKIFMPLVTTKTKGQGFGLAVVKKLTEALNGNVTFDSEQGKGTRFNIELPLTV
jgi:signal transduction histidine kinase